MGVNDRIGPVDGPGKGGDIPKPENSGVMPGGQTVTPGLPEGVKDPTPLAKEATSNQGTTASSLGDRDMRVLSSNGQGLGVNNDKEPTEQDVWEALAKAADSAMLVAEMSGEPEMLSDELAKVLDFKLMDIPMNALAVSSEPKATEVASPPDAEQSFAEEIARIDLGMKGHGLSVQRPQGLDEIEAVLNAISPKDAPSDFLEMWVQGDSPKIFNDIASEPMDLAESGMIKVGSTLICREKDQAKAAEQAIALGLNLMVIPDKMWKSFIEVLSTVVERMQLANNPKEDKEEKVDSKASHVAEGVQRAVSHKKASREDKIFDKASRKKLAEAKEKTAEEIIKLLVAAFLLADYRRLKREENDADKAAQLKSNVTLEQIAKEQGNKI